MNKYLILLNIAVATLSFSCGVKDKKFEKIDSTLFPLIEDYKDKVSIKFKIPKKFVAKTLTAGFSESFSEDGTIGICKTWFDGDTEIEILKSFWEESDEKTRAILVYHEATHCICGRGHTHSDGEYPDSEFLPSKKWSAAELESKGYFPDYCPTSIMNPYLPNKFCINKYWDHYLQEMLEGCELN